MTKPPNSSPCYNCLGTGKYLGDTCWICGGSGRETLPTEEDDDEPTAKEWLARVQMDSRELNQDATDAGNFFKSRRKAADDLEEEFPFPDYSDTINLNTMAFIVIECHGGPQYAIICIDQEGNNLVFETEYEAQVEADNCQDGRVVELQ
jgi:hypothetical protein